MPSAKPHFACISPKPPNRSFVHCACGWHHMVFHRNALARASMAKSIALKHDRENVTSEVAS